MSSSMVRMYLNFISECIQWKRPHVRIPLLVDMLVCVLHNELELRLAALLLDIGASF
ncbi:hypothetical protein T06_13895 [Trichinella sp. T6]|nr:hypothetical protein T06_13895 [Trichinella sp. T6]